MGREDWYRNEEWNGEIEEAFFIKLRRTRNFTRAQYLRIQAYYLAENHPKVALRLLDEFYTLGEEFNLAQAHVVRARAYINLCEFERAITAYEDALAAEKKNPQVKTQADLDLAFLIATNKIEDKYNQALDLLERRSTELLFPSQKFRWLVSLSFILDDSGSLEDARKHARLALETAGMKHSGFRYHPEMGLVKEIDPGVHKRLLSLARE